MSHPQVVRVFCTSQEPDYESPWQTNSPRSSTGSGVVIGKGRILTGAHVVTNATFLQVQKQTDTTKAVARVVAISHDSDLALLHVEDPGFTRGIRPAPLGELPHLRDEVSVMGYPVGGDEVSITEGVVSRIEVQRYEHSQRYLLAVTVDAAINAGNSGGPVLSRGKVIGIAFQGMDEAENAGEMVPAPLIRRFLEGVRRRRSPLIPGLGADLQNLENPSLRAWLGLREAEGGLLVNALHFGGTAWDHMEPGDVLLALDGLAIAGNGTVRYRDRVRCRLDALLGDHYVGDEIRARILRAGKRSTVSMRMKAGHFLVPRQEYDCRPSWFLFGGLVFQKLTTDYLRTWGKSWWEKAPTGLMHHYYYGRRTPDVHEVVVLSQVLADEVNAGYDDVDNLVIAEVNGHRPRDFADFVAQVDGAKREVVLRTELGAIVMLDARAARAALKRIQGKYRVPGDRSADLRA